jgi:AraC-like DNA-binding protein
MTQPVQPAPQLHIREPTAWQQAMSNNVVRCRTRVPDEFHGTVTCHRLGQLDCDWITASQHRADHTSMDICVGDSAIVLAGVVTSGSVWLCQDGRETELGPGEFAIRDSARPYSLAFESPFSQLVIRLPRELLRQRFGPFEHLTAVKISANQSVGKLASDFMLNAGRLRLADPDGQDAERLALQVVDLLGIVMSMEAEARGLGSASTHRSALLYRAKGFIETRLKTALSPALVATALHCSTRYVNVLFASEGTTFGRYVLERRLAQCRTELERGGDRRDIGEIAYAWGFASLSHFSRSFKQRFNVSPSEYRAARGEPGQDGE